MDGNGGWTTFEPQHSPSKYLKYKTRLVIIIAKGKTKSVILTDEFLKKLGNHDYVKVMTRGSNIGFMGVDSADGAYKIGYSTSEEDKKANNRGTAFLNLIALVKEYNLIPGVYDAHVEAGGVIVFDTQSAPSKI